MYDALPFLFPVSSLGECGNPPRMRVLVPQYARYIFQEPVIQCAVAEMVESDESRRFAGEIRTLEEYLKPISSDSRIFQLLKKGITGHFIE